MEKNLGALKIDPTKKRSGRGPGKMVWLLVFLMGAVLAAVGFYIFYPVGSGSDEIVSAASADQSPTDTDSKLALERSARAGREVLIASGYVVAHHKISLGSKVMGKISWIGVEKGDRVGKDQLLVKLDDREYRAQLEQARAAFNATQARLQELEAGSRPQEIERAEAELRRLEAERDNARLEYQRLESLLTQGIISQQEVDNAQSRYRMAEAAVASSRETLRLLQLGPRAEQIAHARAEVAQAGAGVDYFQALLDATEIRAPVDGTVLARLAEVGEMVTTSFAGEMGAKSAVVSMADLNDLQVELDISQSDFNRISPEQDCEMTPEAYPDRVYRCRIDEISPEANRQKATIQVKVKVLEPDEFLRPEMSARVTFLKKEFEVTDEPSTD